MRNCAILKPRNTISGGTVHGSAGASDPYVELVHLLLNTNFTYLTRKLAPSDSLDRARIPVRRGKKLRRGAVRRRPVRLCSRHPVRDQNPFRHMLHGAGALEGGRLRAHRSLSAERADGAQLEEILASQGVPLGLKEQYGVYYRDLPTLSAARCAPHWAYWRRACTARACVQRFQQRDISPEDPSPVPY